MKLLEVGAIVFLLLSLCPLKIHAEFPATGYIKQLHPFSYQPLHIPAWQDPINGKGDILIENFEYWDSPCNHGWVQMEPAYPVHGFGIGYADTFETILDFQEGSRVLDVYRPSSEFLLSTPFEKYTIFYDLFTPPGPDQSMGVNYIDLKTNPILSLKFKAPIGFESWDTFECEIMGITSGGHDIIIKIWSREPDYKSNRRVGSSTFDMGQYGSEISELDIPSGFMSVRVNLGRGYQDGTWHVEWINLREAVQKALDDYDGNFGSINKAEWEVSKADKILLSGSRFCVDDIIFRTGKYKRIDQPDMFEPGPRFAQLFEPYRFLFMADYEATGEIKMLITLLLDPNNFITDHDKIRDTWVADLLRLDPNYHVLDPTHPLYDPTYTNRWRAEDPNFGKPDAVAERFIKEGFFIDSTLALFSNQDFRVGGKKSDLLLNHGTLGWRGTVGGWGSMALNSSLVEPLPIDPYDGIPTFLPTYYYSISALRNLCEKSHYCPHEVLKLESALWNVGVKLWPNVVYMDYEPQVLENLIITLEVTNGSRPDVRTIPITVVNYPVENYPPVIQYHVSRRFYWVGEENYYAIRFIDPDCYIFSMAQFKGREPATSHLPMLPGNKIRTDQDNMTFTMTIDGLPSYQYGPWNERIIDPHNGLISFVPKFEADLKCAVTCRGDRGGTSTGKFIIHCLNEASWLNRPPLYRGNPTRPIVHKAGEEVIVTAPDLKVRDPDGDQLYVSCNIGATGRIDDGGWMWTFQTNFPGLYFPEITFYDEHGGLLKITFKVDVQPWWTY
ncbi:MAG: hypothetical protein ACMUJM_04975 [bacterium]